MSHTIVTKSLMNDLLALDMIQALNSTFHKPCV
jgi:hypothetical protein